MLPTSVQAGLWGLLSGSALLLGALFGYYAHISPRLIAGIMAFGSGVLISALSFDLMDEAYKAGGFDATSIGFVGGAAIYTLANFIVNRYGARHRKRSGAHQAGESKEKGSNGAAIAVGALLDGIPEAIVIGISMIKGGTVSLVAVAAVFLSNIPEGLSSAAGMRKAGKRAAHVFGIWGSIAAVSGLAALAGYSLFSGCGVNVTAAITAVAAGAILAMIADTMIPEAFEETRDFAGLITVLGFLCAFALTKLRP